MEENSYDETGWIPEDEDWLGPDKSFARLLAVSVPTLTSTCPYPLPFFNICWIQRGVDGGIMDFKMDDEIPEHRREYIRSVFKWHPWLMGEAWKFSSEELKNRKG